ncbi:MAG: hypothetical protein KY455_01615 [Euryarchaeota archaeon]|nr:hypothetical protein [Euryarchaeota archaeon]
MDILTDFTVQVLSGLVGVFAGVVLALWTERKRNDQEETQGRERLQQELKDIRHSILSSVVRNASEAKRLVALQSGGRDPYLFQLSFETAVWDATSEQFVRLAGLEERVGFTRFFDQVHRLVRLIDFHRSVRAESELRGVRPDQGDEDLLAGLSDRLDDVAEDVRLEGVVLVSDHGTPLHKRLMGLQTTPAADEKK